MRWVKMIDRMNFGEDLRKDRQPSKIRSMSRSTVKDSNNLKLGLPEPIKDHETLMNNASESGRVFFAGAANFGVLQQHCANGPN